MHGLCACGCGEPAPIAEQSRTDRGWVKGEPKRYIAGHHKRKSFVEYTVDENGCWIWQRSLDGKGYGQAYVGHGSDGRMVRAHRLYYERFKGPIPDGLVIDHLCNNPRCVNPEHLQPVSQMTNVRRASAALTETQARDCARRIEAGESMRSVARSLGVTHRTVATAVTSLSHGDEHEHRFTTV